MSRRFLRSLHEEHIEEIAAHYMRWVGFLDDVEIDVDDVVDLEERIEAHMDALVVGGDPALEICVERAEDGDPGELFAAICVFCRQGRQDLFEAALARFDQDEDEPEPEPSDEDDDDDPELAGDLEWVRTKRAELRAEGNTEDDDEDEDEDEEDDDDDEDEDEDEPDEDEPTPAGALTHALSFEAPVAWQALYERLLAGSQPTVRAAVATMAARRGLPLGPPIVAAIELPNGGSLGSLSWALGRMRERSAAPLLSLHAQRVDTTEAPVALLALLRFGDPSVIHHVETLAQTHPWATSLLAICGGPTHTSLIQARLGRAEVTPEEIIAAGLFGEVSVVPRLLELIAQGLHPEAVAQALYLLTGAPQSETVTEEPEEPEPGKPDPRDRVEVVRLSQDPVAWRTWWEEHQGAFTQGKRYRLGQPASPQVLGQTLHQFVLRRPVRRLAAEEVGLRYWPQRELDVDAWVSTQRAALAALPSLRQSDAVIARADGAWVFARALLR